MDSSSYLVPLIIEIISPVKFKVTLTPQLISILMYTVSSFNERGHNLLHTEIFDLQRKSTEQ